MSCFDPISALAVTSGLLMIAVMVLFMYRRKTSRRRIEELNKWKV